MATVQSLTTGPLMFNTLPGGYETDDMTLAYYVGCILIDAGTLAEVTEESRDVASQFITEEIPADQFRFWGISVDVHRAWSSLATIRQNIQALNTQIDSLYPETPRDPFLQTFYSNHNAEAGMLQSAIEVLTNLL